MLDSNALADLIAELVGDAVENSVSPLLQRIAVLEQASESPAPQVLDMEAVRDTIDEAVTASVAEAVAALPPAEPGAPGQVDMEFVRATLSELVAELPPAKPGSPGAPGQVDMAAVRSMLEEMVATIPPAEPGKSGVGVAGAVIDRDGSLVLTLTDGSLHNLGPVVGKDGDPGDPGEPGSPGRNGPGPEDFNFDLLEDGRTLRVTVGREDDDTEYAFQICLPIPVYRDEHIEGRAYEEGDAVTRNGSLWIALNDTSETPGEGDGWRLAVSRGADGATAYPGQACGLYSPEKRYRALDVVSCNGSEWRAKRDDPGELPGEGWMLSAAKGKRGEPGRTANATPAVAANYIDIKTLSHVITLEDGTELKADLAPLAQEIARIINGG